jgi:hypothetical protein
MSQSQSYFATGSLLPISSSWHISPLETHYKCPPPPQMNTFSYSAYVTSSLTRRWVCCLQLLLALTSRVILGSESHGTHDHILLSQIQDFPNLEKRSPYLYPPAIGWSVYTPRHRVSSTNQSQKLQRLRMNHIEDPASSSFLLLHHQLLHVNSLLRKCVLVAVETCLEAVA